MIFRSNEHSARVEDLIVEVLVVSLAEFKREFPPALLESILKPLLERERAAEPDLDAGVSVSRKYQIALRVCGEPKLQGALEEVWIHLN